MPANPTANELLETIRDLLKPELGVFRSGVPAIGIEPLQSPDTGSGLVVIISRYSIKLNQSVSRWKVTLRQRDRTSRGMQIFDVAVQKMRDRFPLATEVIAPFEEDKYTQATYQIDEIKHFSGGAIVEVPSQPPVW